METRRHADLSRVTGVNQNYLNLNASTCIKHRLTQRHLLPKQAGHYVWTQEPVTAKVVEYPTKTPRWNPESAQEESGRYIVQEKLNTGTPIATGTTIRQATTDKRTHWHGKNYTGASLADTSGSGTQPLAKQRTRDATTTHWTPHPNTKTRSYPNHTTEADSTTQMRKRLNSQLKTVAKTTKP